MRFVMMAIGFLGFILSVAERDPLLAFLSTYVFFSGKFELV